MDGQLRVAVVGATGYAGAELVRLLSQHPKAMVATATSSRSAGRPLRAECPWLETDLVLSEFDGTSMGADVIFLCQEAGFAMEQADALASQALVIDLSADFRLKDAARYETFYQRRHTATHRLADAVYGLPELVDRAEIRRARLIANPGCYPTASLLALMPLVRAGLLNGVPVIDAKSGVSGAGRSRKETSYLFSELSGDFRAYGVTGHRHTPEIEQLAGTVVRFTPHLLPVARGLEATLHVPLNTEVDLIALYQAFYAGETFVEVRSEPPSIKQVIGSNRSIIAPFYDSATGFAVVSTVLDNLVKGAAGQAIQNMNLATGLDEALGLPLNGVWP